VGRAAVAARPPPSAHVSRLENSGLDEVVHFVEIELLFRF